MKRVNPADLAKIMKRLDVDEVGIEIMKKKGELLFFFIKDLSVGGANILKQDALSVGADVALPRGVVSCKYKKVDALLMGTRRQLEQLATKELIQPFNLQKIAKELKKYLKTSTTTSSFPKIMGVINATNDSFYPNSRFLGEEAIKAVEKMVQDGASIIDIGGMSTRPGSEEITPKEELRNVAPIIDVIASREWDGVEFSIDTYRVEVAKYALSKGFTILNDITALENEELAKVAKEFDAKVVLMHKKGTPKTMQENPFYEDVVMEVSKFFEERIEKAKNFGIEKLVLDPGIGFGKRVEDNLLLIRDLAEFKKFGYEVLVGASRKSVINFISPSEVKDRLAGTLTLHLEAVRNGANIIRCHDVFEHNQAFKVFQALREVE
ncbi:MAG: dihydropteroate synthase [Epsilonproteobacteria bacterium]|nr:dihydropteroate synthase [Campylobacterota bacterium]